MRRVGLILVLLSCALVARGPLFAPLANPTVANAAPGDETFITVAGATAHLWSGGSMALGTTGGTLPPSISAVFQWSNTSQAFRFWFRGFPANFNTLASLEKNGFYFFQGPAGVPVTIGGSAGYALPAIGQFTTVAGGATGQLWTGGSPPTLDSLPGAISAIFQWANESQQFRFWFRGFPPTFNTLPAVQAGGFYFFQSNAAVSVNVRLVARVEIDQTGLLFTQAGQTRQLSAMAFDAQGAILTIPITWASSGPSVGVGANGLATAQTNNGSSQVTAQAGGIKSAPLLVIVTQPAPGAVLLNDSQIVGELLETTPGAPPSFDNTYRVTLSGIAAPAIGAVLINTGSKAVAGRVVAVQSAGGQHTVTLQLLSLREMFPTMNLNEVIDLSRAEATIPPDLAAAYDITRTGNTFAFIPKTNLIARSAPRRAGTNALPPFTKCETTLPGLPFELSVPPIFSFSMNLSLDLVYTSANGFERFVIKGEPVFKVEGGVMVTVAFEAKIECKRQLLTFRIPIGGPLALVVGGLIPVGVGLEVGGKVTLASVGVKTAVEVTGTAEIGLACPPGGACAFVKSLEFTPKLTPTVDLPSIGDIRVEPTLMAFGYLEFAIGNPFLASLRFDAFKARAGAKLQGSFAPLVTQITDTSYKSDYKVSLEASAGVGTDLTGLLKLLGLSEITALGLTISIDIAKSPSGAVTADKTSFVTNDTVNFKVTFDRVDFFPLLGPYNVKEVLLVRDNGTGGTVVQRKTATAGQTVFDFAFTSPGPGSTNEFYAFVITKLLPLEILALEIGVAQGATSSRIAFSSNRDGNFEIYTMNPDGTDLVRLTNNDANDWSPTWSPDHTRLAFVTNRHNIFPSEARDEIYVMNANGSGQARLTNNPGVDRDPSWSPDGTKIAYVNDIQSGNSAEIYVMNANGSGQARLAWGDASMPSWSADGKRIAFISDPTGGADYDIYVMNADGSGVTRLTNDTAFDYSPTWSPDGAKIAFASTRDSGGYLELYVMNADGSGVTRLTNTPRIDDFASWSPDSTRIAFITYSASGGTAAISVINADGSGQTPTNTSGASSPPTWSPDGTRIAFTAFSGGGIHIYVMNADGSGLTQITSGESWNLQPSWYRSREGY